MGSGSYVSSIFVPSAGQKLRQAQLQQVCYCLTARPPKPWEKAGAGTASTSSVASATAGPKPWELPPGTIAFGSCGAEKYSKLVFEAIENIVHDLLLSEYIWQPQRI